MEKNKRNMSWFTNYKKKKKKKHKKHITKDQFPQ